MFHSSYVTKRFITAFTTARHSSLRTQSTPSQPISSLYPLILSSPLRLGFPSALFPSGLSTNILHSFIIFSRTRASSSAALTLLDLTIPEYLVKNINHEATHYAFFSSLLLLPLGPLKLSHHPILHHPVSAYRQTQGVIWKITPGGGGGVQNRLWVLRTSIYEEVRSERMGRLVRTSL